MSDQTIGQFRQFIRDISPTWLGGFVSSRFMYSMGIMFDALADGASYAVRARFPAIGPPDALPWIQQDRGIDPGPNESSASFIARLNLWLDLWRLAGSDFSILIALLAYLTPNQLALSIISNSGTWNTYATNANGSITNPPVWSYVTGGWKWDNFSDPFAAIWQWWRSWVVIYDPTNLLGAPTVKWGDGHRWGDGTTWGWTANANVATALRGIVSKWRAAHCVFPQIIVAFDATYFQPASPPSKKPNGTWGHWGVLSTASGTPTYVPSRNPNAIYIDGTP